MFIFVFICIFVGLIGFAIYKVLATRELAKRNGASDKDATTLALFGGDVGTAAAYLKPAVAGEAPSATPAPVATKEELIVELRDLEAKGLITNEQVERRVEEILRGAV